MQMKEIKVTTNHIKICHLSSKDVNDLISDALHLPSLDTVPLTTLVFEKTKGNMFFVEQFLKSLSHERLLYFSVEENKWKWDLNKFDPDMISSNVVELVLRNVLKLDEAMKIVLIVASCVGNPFLLSTLTLITGDRNSVEQVVSQGIIVPIDARKTWHRFAHDHIQEAIFSLIPENDRETTHYKIGKLLWEKCTEKGTDDNIFVTANLLNSGVRVIKDHEERHKIARLNLHAGLKPLSLIAFKTALEYLKNGIKCLKNDSWNDDYDLRLKLHNSAAEAAFCAKEYDYMHEIMQLVFKNATIFKHKVDCYSIQMRELITSRKYKESLEIGLFVLDQLGESIPAEPTESFAIQEVQKTLAMFKNRTEDETFMHTVSNDPDNLRMQLLSDLTLTCYFFWPIGVPILTSRMIQYSLKNGVSKFSAVGFAYFAIVVTHKLENHQEGFRIAQLSLSFLHKFQAKELLPYVYTFIYGQIGHLFESIHKCVELFMKSYQVGLEVGQVVLCAINGNSYCMYSFFIGKSLDKLIAEIRALDERFPLKTLGAKSTYQAVLNLLGKSEGDPGYLIGEYFDYKKITREKGNLGDLGDYVRCLVIRLKVAILFHKYEMASKWANECRPLLKELLHGYFCAIFYFYDGLVAIVSAKSAKEDSEWKTIVDESMAELKKWTKNSENYENKLALLNAEIAALSNEKSKAMKLFDDAIALSKRNKFLSEEALAYERAGIFYLDMKNTQKASHHLLQSYQRYLEWGAIAKAKQKKQIYPGLIVTNNVLKTESGVLQASIDADSFSVSKVSGISFMSESIYSQKNQKGRFS